MTWALLFKTSITASLIPGSLLTAFSTEPAQAEQDIPKTENKALDSDPFMFFSSSNEKPFGYFGIDG